jgi:hypothetical protein
VCALTSQNIHSKHALLDMVYAGCISLPTWHHQHVFQGYVRASETKVTRSMCILAGNTIHLQQPDAIVARVSRMTYGVGCGRSPTAECRRVGTITTDRHGREWCSSHFWPQVKVDEVRHTAVHWAQSVE